MAYSKRGRSKDVTMPTAELYELDSDSGLLAASRQARGVEKDERYQGTIAKHTHDGVNSVLIDIAHISGFIKTVDAAPTWTPKSFLDQFVIYKNGATKRFYWYDTLNSEWDYVVGT